MNDARQMYSWLILTLLVVVGAAASGLAIRQAPSQPKTDLVFAANNTVAATSYTEQGTEPTQTGGSAVISFVYQAPDRGAGYIEEAGKRSYVVVIGSVSYQSLQVSDSTPFSKVQFEKVPLTSSWATQDFVQTSVGFVAKNPTLPSKIQKRGSTYSLVAMNEGGSSSTLFYTVTGPYVSKFLAVSSGGTSSLVISKINDSPPVNAPSLKSIVAAPTTSVPGG